MWSGQRILGKAAATNPPANNRLAAAALIQNRLMAEVPKDSSVVRLTFQHSDPGVVQPVLKQLIDSYFKKHAQIHAVGAFDEFLTQETDQRRSQVAQIAADLRKAKAKVGVISLEDRKRFFSEEIGCLERAASDAEVQLAEQRTAVGELAKSLRVPSMVLTNQQVATNYADAVPPEKVSEYRHVCLLLDALERSRQELLLTYTPSVSYVREVGARLETNEQLKRTLEKANPGLLAVRVTQPNAVAGGLAADPSGALNAEMGRVSALESRIKTLNAQLDDIRKKAAALNEEEGPITDLQRRLSIEETNYSRFSQSLEQSRLDERLGVGKVSNISTIQEPTPPTTAPSRLMKIMAVVLLGGIAAAFGLAFALELYLDPSVKRPIEIENRLHLPLFLSIPRLHLNGAVSRHALGTARAPLLAEGIGAGDAGREPEAASHDPALDAPPSMLDAPRSTPPWDARHELRLFHDALRDRLITYFDLKNLTHKPKLVALTSCGEGAGVTTIAAGLAASLSETGEGKVLLVDMNDRGSAHPFYRGNPACGLEDVLEPDKRDTALVQERLYVVTENQNGDKLPRSLPKHFQHLAPKLKASDYDYIIFDMPPISQVSVTSKLARFMDIALVVVEAEETDREAVKRASSFLAQSGANVGVVLNKTRSYGLKRLHQEL